jgi:hypothetical protein
MQLDTAYEKESCSIFTAVFPDSAVLARLALISRPLLRGGDEPPQNLIEASHVNLYILSYILMAVRTVSTKPLNSHPRP